MQRLDDTVVAIGYGVSYRLDVYVILFTYNIVSQNFYRSQSLGDKYQRAISTMKFNEHDFNHRGTCFKKDDGCRFKIPK